MAIYKYNPMNRGKQSNVVMPSKLLLTGYSNLDVVMGVSVQLSGPVKRCFLMIRKSSINERGLLFWGAGGILFFGLI